MAVCVFIGHRTWNLDNALPRLQDAVTEAVQGNNTVEFLLHHYDGAEPFYDLCLLAANWIKQRSKKEFKITMLVDSRYYDVFL